MAIQQDKIQRMHIVGMTFYGAWLSRLPNNNRFPQERIIKF